MTNKKLRFLLYFYCSFLLFLYMAFNQPVEYRHDGLDYWTTGDCLIGNSIYNIHLELFPKTFRGYFLYFLISLIKRISLLVFGNEYVGWCFFIACVVSYVIVIVLPRLFGGKVDKEFEYKNVLFYVIRYTCIIVSLCFLWKDLLCLPVSDLFSCLFALICVDFLLLGYKNNIGFLFIGGVFLYITYNIRVIYIYAISGIIVYIIFLVRKKLTITRILIGSILLVLGILLPSIPQIMINYHCNGSYTPRVIVENFNGGNTNLTGLLLRDGIKQPRYETYVGDFNLFEEAGVRFIDPSGIELLEREGLDQKADIGIKDILVMFYHYPLDTIGIYTKHVFSALTPIWGQCYITDLYINKGVMILYSITLWYIGILNFILVDEKKKTEIIYMCLLILPGLLNIIGTVEIRYFFMAHLLLYYYVFVKMDFKLLYNRVKEKIPVVVLSYVVVCCIWVTIIGDILSMNDHTMMLIRDSIK